MYEVIKTLLIVFLWFYIYIFDLEKVILTKWSSKRCTWHGKLVVTIGRIVVEFMDWMVQYVLQIFDEIHRKEKYLMNNISGTWKTTVLVSGSVAVRGAWYSLTDKKDSCYDGSPKYVFLPHPCHVCAWIDSSTSDNGSDPKINLLE